MDQTSQEQYIQGRNVTVIGMVVNLALLALKLWGGLVAHSQALIADGVHSLSDLLTDVVALLGLKWGRRGEDEEHPFGHGRIETLSSLGIGLAVLGAGIAMAWSAGTDIYLGRTNHPTSLAIVVAFVSIISKELLFRYTRLVGNRIGSITLMSNAWHHRSDALSSVAVVIGVAGSMVSPRWVVLDSWAAIAVSVLIAKIGVSFIISAFQEFIDTAPDKEIVDQISRCAWDVPGVLDVHDLRARTSGGKVFVEVHVVVNGDMTVRAGHEVAKTVERCLCDEVPGLRKAIVHVDPSGREETT